MNRKKSCLRLYFKRQLVLSPIGFNKFLYNYFIGNHITYALIFHAKPPKCNTIHTHVLGGSYFRPDTVRILKPNLMLLSLAVRICKPWCLLTHIKLYCAAILVGKLYYHGIFVLVYVKTLCIHGIETGGPGGLPGQPYSL